VAERNVDVLIVGAGVAGATCAETLREEGFEGSVLLVGREFDPPYHRPPATKEYLRGEVAKEDAFLRPAAAWAELGIELLTRTSVLGLDAGARTAKLQGAGEVAFDRALLATGAMVRRLPLPGADLDGIHYIRALGNAESLRRDLEHAERVLLVGGSFIGCEVAASLTGLGHACTLVLQEETTLERTIGGTMGRRVQATLEQHGIEVVTGAEVESFAGEERVQRAVLADGREIPGGLVVMGCGAIPDVMLAKRAGLKIGPRGGIACSARLETSAPGIWAAGDPCEYESAIHGRAMRIEHEQVAIDHGRTVARNMLGAEAAHDVVPYFWSDLADWMTLESVGPPEDWDEERERGETVFFGRGGVTVGAVTTGGTGEVDAARDLVRGAAPLPG
jgi:3-phenylpropionate/trans-cinnamate dioxygenase ferredoxin reductase subunit